MDAVASVFCSPCQGLLSITAFEPVEGTGAFRSPQARNAAIFRKIYRSVAFI